MTAKKYQDSIVPFLPKVGWLGEYLRFSDGLEACPRFRFFSAACVLGAAINNTVWLQRGDEGLLPRLMPNIWIVLLAPPYRGHKTSTINMAVNCLTQGFDDVRILADKLTPEAIVHALASPQTKKEIVRIGPRDATGLIKAPEMSVLFGKQQYNTGMVSLITDLYDYREEWKSETIGRGQEILRNNCISIIAGSTPKWLQSMIPQDAFTGGFMRRFIIVEMPTTFNRRIAEPKKPANTAWDKLVKQFEMFRNFSGPMKWTDEGREYYCKFYESYIPTQDDQYDAYMEAESEQSLKLAMLLEINKGSLTLSIESIKEAKAILDAILPETRSRIRSLSTHPRMHLIQEIKEIFLQEEKITESALLNRVYRSLSQGERQFYEALSIMHKAGIITGKKTEKGIELRLKGTGDDLLGKCTEEVDGSLPRGSDEVEPERDRPLPQQRTTT